MSDKKREELNDVDKLVREKVGMAGPDREGTFLTITYIGGFELFNTRPYHNYETWSTGWRVSDGTRAVEREDLDDALRRFFDGSV